MYHEEEIISTNKIDKVRKWLLNRNTYGSPLLYATCVTLNGTGLPEVNLGQA